MRSLLAAAALLLAACNSSSLPPIEGEAKSCLAPGAPECRTDSQCCVGTCWKKGPEPLGQCCLDRGLPCTRPDAPPCCGGLTCTASGACELL